MSANLSDRNRPLSVREREQIRNRIRMNEAALGGRIVMPGNRGTSGEGMSERRQGRLEQFLRDDVKEDAGLIRAKIARDKRILESGDPKNMDLKERQAVERQVKRDSEWVRKQMCPQKLFYLQKMDRHGNLNRDFPRAVEACKREHTEQYKSIANRLKENLRRLDPDGDSNLERFRPKN